jgi:hypothetical protein
VPWLGWQGSAGRHWQPLGDWHLELTVYSGDRWVLVPAVELVAGSAQPLRAETRSSEAVPAPGAGYGSAEAVRTGSVPVAERYPPGTSEVRYVSGTVSERTARRVTIPS